MSETQTTPFIVGNIATYLSPYVLQLQRENLSPRSIEKYAGVVRLLTEHLETKGMPLDAAAITSEHIEDFLDAVRLRCKPATLVTYRLGLHRFFEYLRVSEGEITANPVPKMKVIVPEEPVPVLSDDQIEALLDACDEDSHASDPRVRFQALRDYALILTLEATGGRVSEVVGMTVGDVDHSTHLARLFGKGRKERTISIEDGTVKAIRRYLKVRADRSGAAGTDVLWVGLRGPMTRWGVRQVLVARARQAGLGIEPHPHQFRHTFAHKWLKAGGSESGLMAHNGWRSRTMVSRYAKSAAQERAQEEYHRLRKGRR